jgi:alkylhydroperoxidase family enzyme
MVELQSSGATIDAIARERDELRAEVERLKYMGTRSTYRELAEENNELRAKVERLNADLRCAEENCCDRCKDERDAAKAAAEKLAEALESLAIVGVAKVNGSEEIVYENKAAEALKEYRAKFPEVSK